MSAVSSGSSDVSMNNWPQSSGISALDDKRGWSKNIAVSEIEWLRQRVEALNSLEFCEENAHGPGSPIVLEDKVKLLVSLVSSFHLNKSLRTKLVPGRFPCLAPTHLLWRTPVIDRW